jgi:uncharacterized damage-inducible protein DinB
MSDELKKLMDDYVAGTGQLREALLGMTPEQLAARPIEGKWSTQEVVCHLVDFEIINSERIQRTIAFDNPTVFGADPDPLSKRMHYDKRDVEAELVLLESLRRHMATILRNLSAEQWNRPVMHSEDGQLTLQQLVERTTRHVPHHLPFIAEKRAALAK